MVLDAVWPVRSIRVQTAAVQLVVPGEGELEQLVALAAAGVYDPQNCYLPRSPVAGWEDGDSPHAERSFLRYYWASLADWRPERWNLLFAVIAEGRCIGVQEVGAQDFALTRTVSTGSWLASAHQGRGYGRQMRSAIVQLAFELGAQRAESAAWIDNGPSLGVSRALGYQPNGTTIRAYRGRRQEQVNLVLNRRDWTSRPNISITGLTPQARAFLNAPEPP